MTLTAHLNVFRSEGSQSSQKMNETHEMAGSVSSRLNLSHATTIHALLCVLTVSRSEGIPSLQWICTAYDARRAFANVMYGVNNCFSQTISNARDIFRSSRFTAERCAILSTKREGWKVYSPVHLNHPHLGEFFFPCGDNFSCLYE